MPKVLRPVCPRFMSARGCPWREACYDRHCVSRPDAAPYDLALGVTKVHVERFITYLHNELRFQIDAATESDQESPVGARRKRAVEESHESDNAWYRLRVVHTENKAVEGLRLPGDEALQTADEAAMAASIVSMKHFSEKMAKTTTSSPAASTTDADSKKTAVKKKTKNGKVKINHSITKTKSGRSAFSWIFVVIEQCSPSDMPDAKQRKVSGGSTKQSAARDATSVDVNSATASAHSTKNTAPISGPRKVGSACSQRQHAAVMCLLEDLNIIRPLRRVYVVRGIVATETELSLALSKELRDHFEESSPGQNSEGLFFRVRAFPRDLQERLENKLRGQHLTTSTGGGKSTTTSMRLSNKDPGPTLCAMNVVNGIMYGSFHQGARMMALQKRNASRLGVYDSRPPKNKGGVAALPILADSAAAASMAIADVKGRIPVSRAGWKLVEVFRRRPTLFVPNNASSFVAVDIGASPGGWSYELAALPGCQRVFAVDPGALTQPIPPNVTHLQQKIEDAAPELIAQGIRVDCVVNDMNASPRMTVESLLALRKVIRHGAAVVLTFKNFVGGRAKFSKAIESALSQLSDVLDGMEVLRLFMGGEQERTVVGRWRGGA